MSLWGPPACSHRAGANEHKATAEGPLPKAHLLAERTAVSLQPALCGAISLAVIFFFWPQWNHFKMH